MSYMIIIAMSFISGIIAERIRSQLHHQKMIENTLNDLAVEFSDEA